MNYDIAVYPSRDKLMELAGSKDDKPIVMLNLLKFRDVAEYKDGRAEKISGRTFGGADSSRSAGAPIVEAGLPVLSKNYKGVTLSGGEPAASDAAGAGAGGDEGAVAAAAAAAVEGGGRR